jgi:hypothetical protein
MAKKLCALWVILFTLVGFGLRVQRLNFQPLWGDEGWSFYFAGQSLPNLLALTALDIHPPLYYLLLKLWLFLAGTGAEIARFLSVLAGVLLIPALYNLGRRFFDERVGLMAAAVATGAPLAVYYAQEVRMYQLVTLLGAFSIYFFSRQLNHRRYLWPYVGVTTAALYTHYYAGFIVAAQGLYLLLVYSLTRGTFKNHQNLRPARAKFFSEDILAAGLVKSLLPFVYITLLYLPWLIYLGPRLVNYVANKKAVEGYVSLGFMRFWGDHFIAFSLGHLPTDLQAYTWAALPFVLLAAWGIMVVFAARFGLKNAPLILFYLFIPLLLGYGVNLAFPFTPRYFERTLLLAAPAYWLLIAAGIIWLWDRFYLLVGAFVLALLLAASISLMGFYTIPRYPNEDYRPLLRDIAARATSADTLLASYQWQLGFYQAYLPFPRPRLVAAPGWGQGWAEDPSGGQLNHDLAAILANSPRLWFPAHQALGHIWEDQAETALAKLGYPALLQWYSPQTKLTLTGAPPTSFSEGPTANFAQRLTLLASRLGMDKYEAGRGVVPVQLVWRKEKNLGSAYQVSLRLADTAGRAWSIRDSHPRAGQSFFTDLTPGDTLTDHHGLLISAGTPPGFYRLLLSLRRTDDARPLDVLDAHNQPLGAELLLGQVEVIDPQPPVKPAALPAQVAAGAIVGNTARLVGYSLGNGPFKSGESLPLTLFWQSLVNSPGPLTVSLQLLNPTGEPVFTRQQPPLRPTTAWTVGVLLRDPQDPALPPTLPPGEYRLRVRLVGPNQSPLKVGGQDDLWLTTITTIDRPHLFNPPAPDIALAVNFNNQAQLVGLDLSPTRLKPGDSLPLTLYWQAAAPLNRSWKVFAHLLNAADKIVAQQDQFPGNGQFPTTGWLPGEYITDTYTLTLPADLPPGGYRLAIGLYDPNDFTRLPVVEDGQVKTDQVVLENWPIAVE